MARLLSAAPASIEAAPVDQSVKLIVREGDTTDYLKAGPLIDSTRGIVLVDEVEHHGRVAKSTRLRQRVENKTGPDALAPNATADQVAALSVAATHGGEIASQKVPAEGRAVAAGRIPPPSAYPSLVEQVVQLVVIRRSGAAAGDDIAIDLEQHGDVGGISFGDTRGISEEVGHDSVDHRQAAPVSGAFG